MIIVKLKGGLGNQMFQYAAGRRIAWHNGLELKLDTSHFTNDSLRSYRLNKFMICANIATPDEIRKFSVGGKGRIGEFVRILLARIPAKRKHRFVYEPHYHFDPTVLSLTGDCYLEGYWQSDKYFHDISDIIRNEYQLSEPMSKKNSEYVSMMKHHESVSVHFRFGDYVNNPKTNEYHGVCSSEYYEKAITLVTRKVQCPHFFIFSDDLEMARKSFPSNLPVTMVEENGIEKDYEELILMSRCRHHIIANSSFSWWAAWLGSNPGKIVIAPQKWFNDPSVNAQDIYPKAWMKV
jgi:Glycosyl transferase family 11